jgi:serine/threonine protein kinase
MAAIADFGLSRALAFGQSHLSTRRYGTVTHQPPELLVAGKLTPAADVYSFGIMSEPRGAGLVWCRNSTHRSTV